MAKWKILFIGEATSLTHVARPIVLAGMLPKDTFDPIFACDARYGEIATRNGYSFHQLPTVAHSDFTARLRNGEPPYTENDLRRYVAAETSLFKTINPDLVVGDFRLSLSISTKILDLPYLNICNAYWSPLYKKSMPCPDLEAGELAGSNLRSLVLPFLLPSVLRKMAAPFNKLLVKTGLEPKPDIRHLIADGDHCCYLDLPEVFPLRKAEKKHSFLGPVTWSSNQAEPAWLKSIPRKKPIVFINLGGIDGARLLQETVAAAKELPVTVLVSTNKMPLASKLGDGSNIFASDCLDNRKAAEIASATITNGGAGLSFQSLLEGKPVVGIPTNMDQYLNMTGVRDYGAGLLIRSANAGRKNIKESVMKAIEDSRLKAKAIEVKAIARQKNISSTFAMQAISMVKTGRLAEKWES